MVYKPRLSKPAQDLHAQNFDNIFDALTTSTTSSTPTTDVKYNNQSFGSPIPMVSISYSGNHSGAGGSYGVYRITLTGRAFAGTPPSSGSSGSGGSVLNNIYGWPDGKTLAITVCGVTKSYYNCKVVDESYSETSDHWASTIAYTIVMESHVGSVSSSSSSGSSGSSIASSGSNGSIIVDYNESWSEEPIEDAAYATYSYSASSSSSGTNLGPVGSTSSSGSYVASVSRTRITHRLSVKATNPANPSLAWAEAKRIAHRNIGNSSTTSGTSSGTSSGASGAKYNVYRSISYDIDEGTYEITENWIESSQAYIVDYNIEASTDNRGITTVRVQGQIQGMASGYIGSSDIYASAVSGFNTLPSSYAIANSMTSTTLNTRLVSSSEGHNISKGTISFSYEYDTTPFFLNSSGIQILSENVSITDTGATDVFSEVQVLGRALGPVIQNLGTRTSHKKDINIEVVIQNTGALTIAGPPSGIQTAVQNLINQVKPFASSGQASQGFAMLTSDNSTWSPTEARFSRAVSWTYSYCSTANLT
jgi:hypothetical protein